MIVIDETVVGVWYVSYVGPADLLCMLHQLPTHFQMAWYVRRYNANGEIENTRKFAMNRVLVPVSFAIEQVRKYIQDARNDDNRVEGEWEVLRGGRTVEEFGALIGTMPYARAREATPEEAAQIDGVYGVNV